MTATDTCLHPYPEGNSSLRRMALEAGALGFDSIVVPDTLSREYYGVRIISAILIVEPNPRIVSGLARANREKRALVLVNAGENGFNRAILNLKGIHILRQIHKTRKNSFDHVSARLAAERGIAVDIDLYPVIHNTGLSRQRVLQRYHDLISLFDRYRFPLTLSSNAYSILDLRSVEEICLLCELFGMEEEDVLTALGTAGSLMNTKGPVTVVS
jgi:ribonuclease P/MRP protein subunit RPP1